MAREGRLGNLQQPENAHTHTQVSQNTTLTSSGKTANMARTSDVSAEDRLTQARPFGHLYNAATPTPKKGSSSPHLGRNYDSYA
jgi:hypothetical protein